MTPRSRVSALFICVLLLGVSPSVAAQPAAEIGADTWEAAYLFVIREHLRPAPPQELLGATFAGLAGFLRDRGLRLQIPSVTGDERRDVVAVRDSINAIARLTSSTTALEAAYAAVDSMLRTLGDPHTRLAFPTGGGTARRPGGYSGIGVILDIEVHPPAIASVLDGGPAQRAGVRPGDIIMEIDGRLTATMPTHEVVTRLRGLPGSSVALRLRRGPVDMMVTVMREIIGLRESTYRKIDTIGYVRLRTFDEGAGEEMTAVVADLQRQGIAGLILDLRGNPGGYIDEAVQVASLFLARGLVTTVVTRTGVRTRYPVVPSDVRFGGPVAILVDRESASAAEMLAGAMQEAGYPVIGTRTYGKGTVQVTRRLPGGAYLFLTVAQYLTPNGVSVEGRGILPTSEIEADAGTLGTDWDRAIRAAIEVLTTRAERVFRRWLDAAPVASSMSIAA